MDHWPFIIAAYGITAFGTVVTSIWAWRTAMSAEARADSLRQRD